jgi:hypothetical protein
MRTGRQWWLDEFSLKSAGDYLEIELADGTHESQCLKQVATYWGMATPFVLDGALSEETFLKTGVFAGDIHGLREGPALSETIAQANWKSGLYGECGEICRSI